MALDQTGERADHALRHRADQLGAEEHLVDVPVRVVVREDRLRQVRRRAGRLQVAGGTEDRVDWVSV